MFSLKFFKNLASINLKFNQPKILIAEKNFSTLETNQFSEFEPRNCFLINIPAIGNGMK